MNYISIGIIMLISFILTVIITKFEIPILREKAGQNIREDGPQSHLSKAGTPSMGGIAIIIGAAAAAITAEIIRGGNTALETAVIVLVFVGLAL